MIPEQATLTTEQTTVTTEQHSTEQTETSSNDRYPDLDRAERKIWREKGVLPERSLDPDKQLSGEEMMRYQRSGELPDSKEPEARASDKMAPDAEEIDTEVSEGTWSGQVNAQQPEGQRYFKQVDKNLGAAVQYLQKNPQALSTLQSTVGANETMWQDVIHALGEVKNSGDVIKELANSEQARAAVVKSPNWQTLRWNIQQISRSLGARPKPAKTRATAVGAEVSGRGDAPGDPAEDASRRGDVRGTFAAWNREVSSGKFTAGRRRR